MHKNLRLLLVASLVLVVSWQATCVHPSEDSSKEASCYSGPTPVIGHVPNPNGCNTYFTCYEDSDGTTTYVRMNCTMGHQGMLFWDFRNCRCEHKENALCFTEEDTADYYKCTCPLDDPLPFPECLGLTRN